MRMTEMSFPDARPVEGYGPGFFRIGGEVRAGPLLTGPDGVTPWTGLQDTGPLLALVGTVDVLFLGTGSEIAVPPAELRQALETAGIGVETMASPTACRTYNVTLSEGRRVALAALPV
ncbi:MAG: Mth938-like domain-containing protein [Pseudomonadota bacterium]